jgi:hypothetical protein
MRYETYETRARFSYRAVLITLTSHLVVIDFRQVQHKRVINIRRDRINTAQHNRIMETRSTWNPEADEGEREQRNAMAARGYWQPFQAVQKNLSKILKGENPGEVADANHGAWYRELFAPSVTVGLLKPADLDGYRNGLVYIRKSMHVPLNRDAVRDAMPAFFNLLREEPHPAVRVVLGHFIFDYIHP